MSLNVNGISNTSVCNPYERDLKRSKNVAFTARKKPVDKNNNNKFDTDIAIKNFGKGLLSPITAVINHPLATIGLVAGTAAACSLVPVLGPLLAIGFGAMGVAELGKSGYNIVKNIKNGDYDKAEQNFEGLGQGTINTLLSALGVKQGARVAKEAKMLESLKVKTLTSAQKEAIMLEVKNGSFMDAAKEILSLATNSGRKAIAYQFKPSVIKARANEMLGFLKGKKVETKETQTVKQKFTETAEGRRRAAMTSEEIEAEITKLSDEAFKEYGIPEELRPKIEIEKGQLSNGGGYHAPTHTIRINETAYREGSFDLPNVIKHEATHAKKALIRETLSGTTRENLAKEYLLGKIQNGDNNSVVHHCSFFGFETMTPPKMSPKMRAEFAKFAETSLYKDGQLYKLEDLIKMVEPLLKSNPEFAAQYSNETEAVNMLAQYARSHNMRFFMATKTNINLTPEQLAHLDDVNRNEAILSFKDHLECIDGNASNSTFSAKLGLGGGDFDQYQFGAEEVLAQQKGNQFAIKHYEQELEALRAKPGYSKEQESYLLNAIEKAKATIEYKTKGKEYYRLFMESQRHPENEELAQQVANMSKELEQLAELVKSHAICENGKSQIVIPIEQEVLILKKIKPNLTIFVPYSTTSTADILAS